MNQTTPAARPRTVRRARADRPEPEGTAIAIFVVDDEPIASRILYVSPTFLRMSGYSAEQLVGHSALLLAGARPRPEHLRAVEAAFAGAAFPARWTETKTRPDGSRYDAEVELESLPRAPGRPLHVVLTQRRVA